MRTARGYRHLDELPSYWHEDEARFALTEWESSGLTLREFALAHGIHLTKLQRWRRRLFEPTSVRFLELVTAPAAPQAVEPFRLHLGPFVVEVPPGFQNEELSRLLEVLEC